MDHFLHADSDVYKKYDIGYLVGGCKISFGSSW